MSFETAPTKTIEVNGTSFAYREAGEKSGVPVIFLHHLTAVLDDWDPRVVDGFAAKHHVIAFDNRGVGASGGATPATVEEMARDAVAFIRALGLSKVDLLGFSLGGFVAQAIVQEQPDLVRKLIIAGSGPAGGEGISNMGAVLQDALAKAGAAGKHPKNFLFFSQTGNGQAAANAFLARLNERKNDRDAAISNATIGAQLTAIHAWGQAEPSKLSAIHHPVLVVNGDDDVMAPTINSFELARLLPNAQLSIFPDAGHGGIFQYHDVFVQQALDFLR
ncbi:alpha/beta hydrolase [Neorhizobium sp. P12A]|uniref:alpha/beta fold hydrolase n=1 Tax=Neorhizobium sp. P12A TaxID=2268027 RepID=UPI0011EE2E95|nr:alpha/beta hydrolase [Neorhizobium sp. P12A]KAA0686895.1 alpha/beta hydrolase [Neorhizobium sp. P12A]